jgi:hypothetical protein
LKKARQAHAATPSTAAGPELRPLRNPSPPPRRALPIRSLIFGAVVAFVVVASWVWFGAGHRGVEVRAKALPVNAEPSPAPVAKASAPAASPAVSQPAPIPVAKSVTASVDTALPPPPSAVVATEPAPPTDTPPAAADAPPAAGIDSSPPTTFILQGLFVSPRNPVAIINGRSVSIGGHVDDARVVAIDLHSATIVTAAGRTNVLEMSDP